MECTVNQCNNEVERELSVIDGDAGSQITMDVCLPCGEKFSQIKYQKWSLIQL